MNLLEIKDLKKSFGKREILKGVNFSLKENDKIAILGSNGSGKSTLINIILGLLKKDSGEIIFPKDKTLKNFISNIGIQFQEGNFPMHFKVQEVIEVSIEQKSNFKYKEYFKWKEEKNKMISEFLGVFKLEKIKKQKIKNLSGGEKQRLNILLAMISKPKILILDEISTGLDIKSQKELIIFIENYINKNNCTLIIISHIIYEIEQLTKEILILDEGVIKLKEKITNVQKKWGSLTKGLDRFFVEGKDL